MPVGFNDTWLKCRTGSDDVSHTRMTTLPFLRLPLSPIVIFDSDNPLIGVRSVGQRLFGRFLLFLVEM